MRREALIEGVSIGEGVAAACGHNTKHSTGRRRQQIQGQTAAPSPSPLPTRHHVKAHRTTLLAILRRPREGLYTTGRAGVGFFCNPAGETTAGSEGVDRGRFMHKEALGDFNQALATRGRIRGLGSGLHGEEMAPGKVKGRGLRKAGTLWRSPIMG